MPTLTLDKVSDKELEDEYRKRFYLKAGDKVYSSADAAKHFTAMLTEDPAREYFIVMFVNGANRLITCEVLFKGSLMTSAVYPSVIIKKALLGDAAAIICGHNHPSGNLNPSQDDLTVTKKIKAACDTVDLAFHDHLIVAGESGWYSFADHGLM